MTIISLIVDFLVDFICGLSHLECYKGSICLKRFICVSLSVSMLIEVDIVSGAREADGMRLLTLNYTSQHYVTVWIYFSILYVFLLVAELIFFTLYYISKLGLF